MKVGLFFGSFNPVHVGHMVLANYMLSFSDLDRIWFVVSPQNPFKEKKSLLADYHRLELVNRAIGDNPLMQGSNIEFALEKPSYTVDTLTYLVEKYPDTNFSLIMGGDNLKAFHKWKNYEQILQHHDLLVYPRPGENLDNVSPHILQKTTIVQAPLMEVSSSFIRKSIINKKDVRYFMPSSSFEYLDEMNFYR